MYIGCDRDPANVSTKMQANSSCVLRSRKLESNVGGNRKLNLSSGVFSTEDFQYPADPGRALTHTWQPPMSFTTGLEHVGVDSTPIVAYSHAQIIFRVFKFELYALSS